MPLRPRPSLSSRLACATLAAGLAFAAAGLPPCARGAVLDLTLYNTYPLREPDGVTPLSGGQYGGDLVQLLRTGANNVPDVPNMYGYATGDDSILTSFYVGTGTIGPYSGGLFVMTNILLPDSYAGTKVYARFWDAEWLDQADHYGNSSVLNLPAPDPFGEGYLDIAPLVSSPRTAGVSFSPQVMAIPEPSAGLLAGFACSILLARRRFLNAARHSVRPAPDPQENPGWRTADRL